MTSIVRPSPAQTTRRVIVLGATVFAVVVAQAQMLLGWGQSAAEFAADSDANLRVAGYAFAIWGVIYAALAVYALRQILPQTGESDAIRRFGWPSVLALVGIGAWIVAAAFDWEWATIVLIFGSLLALLVPLLSFSGMVRSLARSDRDRWMTIWPLSLLAGWLTVAAPLNLITVLTGNGQIPTGGTGTLIAVGAIVAVVLVALAVTWRLRILAYALPIAWGLLGAFVAEQTRNAPLGFFALAAAVVVLVGAVIITFRLKAQEAPVAAPRQEPGEAHVGP